MNHDLAGIWEVVADKSNDSAANSTKNINRSADRSSLTIDMNVDMDEIVILPFNEHEYYVGFHTAGSAPAEETLNLRGFITPFEGLYFANLQPLSDDGTPENYIIYQFELESNNLLTLKHIDHDMDHIKTTEALRAFVKDVIERDDFDEDDIMKLRKKEME
ncbi:MAG: hypothetical protein AB8G77_17365 [Rhodothermales bacterium]